MPTTLRVTCILWLIAAVFMILNSSLCLVVWHFGGFKDGLADGPTFGATLFRYYGVMATAQLAGSLVLLVGAIASLRRKPYGRFLLQVACIFGLLFILGFDVLWLTPLFEEPPYAPDRTFLLAFTLAGILGSLFFMVPPVLTLWLLRRPHIRAAFAS